MYVTIVRLNSCVRKIEKIFAKKENLKLELIKENIIIRSCSNYEGLDKYVQQIREDNNKSLIDKNENSYIVWKIMIYILSGAAIFIVLLKLLLDR